MPLLLVRHASAGDRNTWRGADRDRPLDGKGKGRAKELVAVLEPYRLEAILTSPARRCLETISPLARARGLEIAVRQELDEEHQLETGAALVRTLAGRDVVVCGHGGLERLVPSTPAWKKGAVLVLGGDLEIVEVL